MTTLDICICTFQRDSVVDTIASLMGTEIPEGVEVQIIVVDNDDKPSAKHRVKQIARSGRLPVHYIHCSGRNISTARNACLDASMASFVAFIDDDELAGPTWLSALVHEQRRSNAQVVIGPVDAVYAADAPDWMRRARAHSTRPVWTDGQIRTGYTCNALIDRRTPQIRGLRFDLSMGQSGGEDTDFFNRIFAMGGMISYAPEAVILEPVTPGRLAFGWLARRRFRMGQTHALTLLQRPTARRWRLLPVATAKLTWCMIAAALSFPDNRLRNISVLRGCLHAGVIAGLVGHSPISLYGSDQAHGGGKA